MAQRRPAWSYKRKTTCLHCGQPRTWPKFWLCRLCRNAYRTKKRHEQKENEQKLIEELKRKL